jgi:hypothetical protein
MIDQDFEVIEVALTVVTPGTREHLVEVGVITLLLCHPEEVIERGRCRELICRTYGKTKETCTGGARSCQRMNRGCVSR